MGQQSKQDWDYLSYSVHENHISFYSEKEHIHQFLLVICWNRLQKEVCLCHNDYSKNEAKTKISED